MGDLSFFSTVEDLVAASDDQILQQMGSVSPEVVMEYVLYLRRKIDQMSKEDNTSARPPAYNPEYRDDVPGSSRESREVTDHLRGLKVVEGEASLKEAEALQNHKRKTQDVIHGSELKNFKDFAFDKRLRIGDKIIAQGFLNSLGLGVNFRSICVQTTCELWNGAERHWELDFYPRFY